MKRKEGEFKRVVDIFDRHIILAINECKGVGCEDMIDVAGAQGLSLIDYAIRMSKEHLCPKHHNRFHDHIKKQTTKILKERESE